MNTKIIVGAVIGVLVVAGGSFYAGIRYANQSRGARFAQVGAGGPTGGQFFRTGAGGARNGGFLAGTVVTKDSTSISIELGGPNASSTNGSATGSKIVLYNGSTQIGKFSSGTSEDLKVGDAVTVQGEQNSDGSVTAQTIQIRPVGVGIGPRGVSQ